jgi:hypothetical protein
MSDLTKKGVDPQILQIIYLDELCGRIEELTENLKAYNRFKGPMTRPFKRSLQYQYATIPAGGHGRVYYLKNPQPDLLMGVITQVGNSWFSNTYLEWFVDYDPKKVEYVVGEIHNPKEYEQGIPFEYEVEWLAWNQDSADHTFEVLCDGFFLPKEVYNKIVR